MKTTIDISKASFASFGYVNKEGCIKVQMPTCYTVHGVPISNDAWAYPLMKDFPFESPRERARRLDILDTWTPIVIFHFNSRQTVTYKGDKAESLWRAWNAKVFGKKKG